MVVMGMKISVILVEKFLGYLDGYIYQTSIEIHSNALPLGDVILGGNGNL